MLRLVNLAQSGMKTAPVPTPTKILLVDDNRDGLLVRRLLLEELGYCVDVAGGGEEGLKLFEGGAFDVVVSDYRMPRMNGVEFMQRIRQMNPNARVILLSGFVEPMGLTEENTGADAVIAKSSNEAAHLVRSIKRLVSRQTLRKPPASQKKAVTRARITNLAH
jgi:two-component system, NtrC family, nitrogen regulation response regulator NtrX